MPVFLTELAARLGVAQRFQKLAAWGMVVAAAIALWFAGKAAWRAFWHHHDTQVVTNHDATARADALNATVAADRSAGENQQVRDDANSNEQQALETDREKAISSGSDPWDAISNQLR